MRGKKKHQVQERRKSAARHPLLCLKQNDHDNAVKQSIKRSPSGPDANNKSDN
jgi:hypothetical protein